MAKKKSRKSRQSKGIVGSPAKARTSVGIKRLLNQLEAHRAGKNTRVTIPGLDSKNRLVKVPGVAVWGKTQEQRRQDKRKNAS